MAEENERLPKGRFTVFVQPDRKNPGELSRAVQGILDNIPSSNGERVEDYRSKSREGSVNFVYIGKHSSFKVILVEGLKRRGYDPVVSYTPAPTSAQSAIDRRKHSERQY